MVDQTPAPTGPLLLTAAEAARALAISPRTLWALTQRGEIPALKIGRRAVRYNRRDLLAYVDQLRQEQAVRRDGGRGTHHE